MLDESDAALAAAAVLVLLVGAGIIEGDDWVGYEVRGQGLVRGLIKHW